MTGRTCILLFMVAGLAALAGSPLIAADPIVVWNATASAPVGFYRVTTTRDLRPDDLVLAHTPPAFVPLFAERGYVPAGVPLLKRVAALAGSTVCRRDRTVTVDGVVVAEALATDGRGRAMPAWHGCRPVGPGEVFLLVPEVPASLDGRYFGVVETSTIIGRAVPLWTW
jgi:conjugative transfer signal peptidase TraF